MREGMIGTGGGGRIRLSAALPGLAPALVLALPAAALVVLGGARSWSCDDAFIDFRVAENLLRGEGPVFNVGERVEAFTNPLWVALLGGATGLARLLSPRASIEWIACVLSLTAAGAGLLMAALGGRRWLREAAAYVPSAVAKDGSPAFLPLGAACVAALPPFWDFATSGLETALALGWLGTSYWAIAVGSRSTALLLSAGPLIRPDLAIYSVAFFAAHLLRTPARWRWVLGQAAQVLAAPLAYQIFRMGYFGAVVPNTALAKEAGLSAWERGLPYLLDFAAPYGLWAPAALAVWIAGRWCRTALRAGAWRLAGVPLAAAVAAALHTLYVLRVGGDFMHARMLLPAFFAWMLPISAVPWPATRLRQAEVALALIWCGVCGLALRIPYAGTSPPMRDGIADERGFYVFLSENPRPLVAEDYRWTALWQLGYSYRSTSRRTLLLCCGDWHGWEPPRVTEVPLAPALQRPVGVVQVLGVSSFVAGGRVHVVDRLGLADPLASRLRLESRGDRRGHEKFLPDAWILARFADWRSLSGSGIGPQVDSARAALACGDLGELMRAITEPLSFKRFVRNVALSPKLSALRFDANPFSARAELCGPG